MILKESWLKVIIISFWKRAWLFFWTFLNFLWGCFVAILVEICILVLEKMIFNCTFAIISPWKRMLPFIWKKLDFPSPKDALCQLLLKLALWFWRKRWNRKMFTDSQMDRWWKRRDQKSFLLRWAKMSKGERRTPSCLGRVPRCPWVTVGSLRPTDTERLSVPAYQVTSYSLPVPQYQILYSCIYMY